MTVEEIRQITPDDDEYPSLLREGATPPKRLWVRGRRLDELPNMVAVVGSRTPTPYGEQVAEDLAADLAVAGLCIVSGLARGCDGAAHRGALRAAGTTVAVLAGGLDAIHPRMHAALAERVAANGALVSEYPPGTGSFKGHFVERNRIIAWLSRAVVVVQGGRGSGAMTTADRAKAVGRDLFGVPGNIDVDVSFAPHNVIRTMNGRVCTGAGDVLDAFKDLPASGEAPSDISGVTALVEALPRDVRDVLRRITRTPQPLETVVARSGLPARKALAAITRLELAGLIARGQTGGWVRVK